MLIWGGQRGISSSGVVLKKALDGVSLGEIRAVDGWAAGRLRGALGDACGSSCERCARVDAGRRGVGFGRLFGACGVFGEDMRSEVRGGLGADHHRSGLGFRSGRFGVPSRGRLRGGGGCGERD